MSTMEAKSLRRALAQPRYEVIPVRGALEQTRKLPPGSTVTVTCSPSKGIAATLELSEQLRALDYNVVPHLAARRFQDYAHLDRVLARLDAAGIRDIFVVGGDGNAEGTVANGSDLIRAISQAGAPLNSIGIPCYPEGHSSIAMDQLDAALDTKSDFAAYMVTQICFDAAPILRWLHKVRERGIVMPVYVGIPGMIERRKMMTIALRIGLGDSSRFIKKNGGMISRLAGPSRYSPDALIQGLQSAIADPTLNMVGFHINTFNQVGDTEAWRDNWLKSLDAAAQYDQAPAPEPVRIG